MASLDPIGDFAHAFAAVPLWAGTGAAVGALGAYTFFPAVSIYAAAETAAVFCALQPVIMKIIDLVVRSFRNEDPNSAITFLQASLGVAAAGVIATKVIGYTLTLGATLGIEAGLISLFALGVLISLEYQYQQSGSDLFRLGYYNETAPDIIPRLLTPLQSQD